MLALVNDEPERPTSSLLALERGGARRPPGARGPCQVEAGLFLVHVSSGPIVPTAATTNRIEAATETKCVASLDGVLTFSMVAPNVEGRMEAPGEHHILRQTAAWTAAGFAVPYGVYGVVQGAGPGQILPLGLVLAAALLAMRTAGERVGPMGALWPVLIRPAIYQGAVGILQLAPERYIDATFARADALLLGYPGPPRWALGGPVEELANAFYVSYYLVVPLALLWVWRRSDAAALRYGLALLLAMTLCGWGWLLAPAGGYHPAGYPTAAEAFGPFTRAAHLLYANNPHFAAAFPSSHVGVAVALVVVLRSLGASRVWWFWALGVALSTFYCQYHFVVDAPGGLVAGGAALAVAAPERSAEVAAALERIRRRK